MPQSFFKIIFADITLDLPQDAAALVINNRGCAGIDHNVLAARYFDGNGFVQGIPVQDGFGHAV